MRGLCRARGSRNETPARRECHDGMTAEIHVQVWMVTNTCPVLEDNKSRTFIDPCVRYPRRARRQYPVHPEHCALLRLERRGAVRDYSERFSRRTAKAGAEPPRSRQTLLSAPTVRSRRCAMWAARDLARHRRMRETLWHAPECRYCVGQAASPRASSDATQAAK
jgi:hypothetical protein